jgi:predicted PurR-regulated permease PerM
MPIEMTEKNKFYLFLAASAAAFILVAFLAPGAFKVLALSFGLAYLLDPLVDRLEEKNVPRSASIAGLLAAALLILVLLFSLIIPYIWNQGVAFVDAAPELVERAIGRLVGWGIIPEDYLASVPQLTLELREKALAGGMDYIKPVVSGIFKATSGLMGIVLALVNFVIIPVFFFYMLRDIDRIRENFYHFVPDSVEENIRGYLGMVDGVLGGFIRGQMVVALCLAGLYSIGLLISGLRFGAVIGVVAGILSVIPYVGFLVGILASAVVVLVDFSGWGLVVGVAATFGISQTIEGYILTPRFVGNRVGLNPLETLIAVLVGGEMGGFPGLLMAIPAGGVLKKTVGFLRPGKEEEEEIRGSGDTGYEAPMESGSGGEEGEDPLAEG